MPYYLAACDGMGTAADPFRPAGLGNRRSWSAIDLRPDPTVPVGWFLVHTPTAMTVSSQVVRLADTPDETTGQIRTTLQALGVTLTPGVSFRQAVLALLLAGDDSDPNRWNRLRPSKANRRYEVWLGGELLASMPDEAS